MAEQQEKFTPEEYRAWKKVNRIMAETEAEDNNEQTERIEPTIDSTVDPAGAFAQRQKALNEKPKPVYTDEDRKIMKDLVNRSR